MDIISRQASLDKDPTESIYLCPPLSSGVCICFLSFVYL